MPDYRTFFGAHAHRLAQAPLYRPRRNSTFRNPEFAAASARVLIVRLSPFQDVDRSLPHLFLADAARRAAPAAYVDFAFLPPAPDRRLLRKAGVPLLTGVQSFRPVEDFNLVLVSNAFILELINLPLVLRDSSIPTLSRDRDGRWPPFVLGGSNAMACQSVIGEHGESLVDAVFFGEGEGRVERLIAVLLETKGGLDKAGRLAAAASAVDGLWIAGQPADRVPVAAVAAELSDADIPSGYPRLNSDDAGTARLQITWGCAALCAFCFEGYDRRPYREMPRDAILAAARRLKTRHGCETIELYGFNVSDHGDFLPLLLDLNRQFQAVSLKSQRVDALLDDPRTVHAEVVAGKRSFTLGIEGISERMRRVLHKGLSTEAIWEALDRVLREPVREIKLFFVLMGDETPQDLQEFEAFCGRLSDLRARHRAGARIITSFGYLVRMPWTPLRHAPLKLDAEGWTPRVQAVETACRDAGLEFRMSSSWAEYAVTQVLALGGHWLLDMLAAMAGEGACYDGRLDAKWWDWLRRRLEADGRWTREFLGEKTANYAFPLSFVKPRVSSGFLFRQYLQSKAAQDEGGCLGRQGRPARCAECGACLDPAQRRAVLRHASRGPAGGEWIGTLETAMKAKGRLRPLFAVCRVPAEAAGVHPAWVNACGLERLLAACPDATDNLLSVREQLFSTGELADRFGILPGETVFALTAWEPEALARCLLPARPGGDDFTFLRWVPTYKQGVFAEARLDLEIPPEVDSHADARLVACMHGAELNFSLRREGGAYAFDLSTRAKRQGGLRAGGYRIEGERLCVRLTVGPKFRLRGLLDDMDLDVADPRVTIRLSDLRL